jgi:hypothetical protein
MRSSGTELASGLTRRRVGRAIAVALAVAVAVLAVMLLSRVLASRLRQRLVAEAARYGLSLRLDQVDVRFLPGRVALRGVRLCAPSAAGGGESEVLHAVSVCLYTSPLALLWPDDQRVRRVAVDDVVLTVESTRAGGERLPAAAGVSATPATGAVPKPPASTPVAGKPERQRHIRIDDLRCRGTVRYSERADGANPAQRIEFRALLDGRNLSWSRGRALDTGDLSLSGHLLTNRTACVTALRGTVLPSTNGWSFDVAGTVSNADPRVVVSRLASSGLTCGTVDMRVALACRGERFDGERSRIALDLREVTLASPNAAQPQRLFRHLALNIPVGGTLSRPEPNLAYALLNALSQPDGADGVDISRVLLKDAGKSAGAALRRLLGTGKRNPPAVTNAPVQRQPGGQSGNEEGTP